MSISIKILDQSSLSTACKVITRGFSTVAEEFGFTRANCPTHPAFLHLEDLERDYLAGYQMLGLYASEQLASFVALERDGNICHLHNLSTLPPCRHRGYGQILLQHGCHTAALLGAETMAVSILDENVRLKNWFLASGFLPVHTEPMDGFPFSVVQLSKSLIA